VSFNVDVQKKMLAFLSCDITLEFWCQGFEYKRSATWGDDTSITKYIIRNLSALHIAAIFGIKKLAVDVLEKRPSDPSPRDSAGRTRLMLAAAHGNSYILELLLSTSNVDVNCTDPKGKTALGYAIQHSQVNIVQILVSSAQPLDINIGSPFWDACMRPDGEILGLLLSRADLDVNPDTSSDSAIWFHMAKYGRTDVLKIFLARKDFDPYRWSLAPQHESFFN
jgi:ankyrin repeat protein